MMLSFVCTSIMVLSVLLAGGLTCPAEAQMKIVCAHFDPEQSPNAQTMMAWGKELEERTNGKVKLNYAFGGSMGGPGEYHDLVSKGIVDVSLAVLAFGGPGRFPMIEVIALPYYIPKAEIGAQAMTLYWKKGHMDEELREVKPVAYLTGQGDTLYTRDKPVTTLDDMKGLKISAATPLVQQKVKLWGGVPLAIPFTDLYMALQKKTIDGIMLNYNVMVYFKLNEVLNYATLPATGSVCSAFVMNKKTFEKLPPEGKAFVEETGMKYSKMFGMGWDKMCDMGRDLFLKTGGKEVQWAPSAIEKRAELEGPMWEAWIADKEKRGLPGRQAVDDLYYIFKDLGVDPTAVGYAPSK